MEEGPELLVGSQRSNPDVGLTASMIGGLWSGTQLDSMV